MWIIGTSLPPANKVCKGNVFTGVCLSTCGVSAPLHAGKHTPRPEANTPLEQTPPQSRPPGADTPAQCMLGDTANKRAVRIPLECILVHTCFPTIANNASETCSLLRDNCPFPMHY